jgi:hypothetical protein
MAWVSSYIKATLSKLRVITWASHLYSVRSLGQVLLSSRHARAQRATSSRGALLKTRVFLEERNHTLVMAGSRLLSPDAFWWGSALVGSFGRHTRTMLTTKQRHVFFFTREDNMLFSLTKNGKRQGEQRIWQASSI